MRVVWFLLEDGSSQFVVIGDIDMLLVATDAAVGLYWVNNAACERLNRALLEPAPGRLLRMHAQNKGHR